MYRIGILGAAGIAPRSIIQPVGRRDDIIVHAVASRRAYSARDYAERHGIALAYDSYEKLLADPGIDLIYNALPPAGHAEWSITALKAGKHVLCEKPIAMSVEQAREMYDAAKANGKVLMEAFHDRYHPVFLHLMALKKDGLLDNVWHVRAEFYVNIPFDEKSIRHDPAQGGGCMMDLGCYPLHWLRSFFGSEPEIVSASARKTPLSVDESMTAELRFGEIAATLIADIARPPFEARLRVETETGFIEIDNPVLPHKGHAIRHDLTGALKEFTLAGGTTYDYQLAAFLEAVNTGREPITGAEDSINNMIALERIYETAGFSRPLSK